MHYQVPTHQIELKTFVVTALQAQRIADSINEQLFNNALDFKLVIAPPAEGSFLGKIKICIIGSVGAFYAFINTPVGESYITGLTGHPPAYWAEEIGKKHSESVSSLFEHKDGPEKTAEVVVTEMTKGILTKTNDELIAISPLSSVLHDAINARCDFYDECISNADIAGIGFTEDDKFPIERNQFPVLAARPRALEQDEQELEWHQAIETVRVTSPNWDKNSQNHRKWKGRNNAKKDCLFSIEDELFWHHVKFRELRVEIFDELKVQWVFQIKDKKIANLKVLRVLEFNGTVLADTLTDKEIDDILGTQHQKFQTSVNKGLFD